MSKKKILDVILFLIFLMSCNKLQASVCQLKIDHKKEVFPDLSKIIDKIMPSVVSINIEGVSSCHVSRSYNHILLFRNNNSPIIFHQKKILYKKLKLYSILSSLKNKENIFRKFHALGSGVIIDSEQGYVVTNSHVIKNARKIEVTLYDHRCYLARLVGLDLRSDIALLKLNNAHDLKSIKLSDSDLLNVGDYALAIGNPYGLDQTVTFGIISALGRTGLNLENYENFIQTDAAINRGNSGGALINVHGDLIGINTAILAPNGGNIGIGFAIPSNMVKHLTDQLAKYGTVKRGEIGIIATELNSKLSKIMKINLNQGVFVTQVLVNSSADKSGIKPGDVIVSMNKKIITNISVFKAEISSYSVNSKVNLNVIRNRKLHSINLKLGYGIHQKMNLCNFHKYFQGAKFSNYLDKQLKLRGVKVDTVQSNSPADHFGFKSNDVILCVNKQSVINIDKLRILLSIKSSIFAFHIQRGGKKIYLII